MKRIVLDIESDGLLDEITQIWCVCTKDVDTGEEVDFPPSRLDQLATYLQGVHTIIGHNIISFDVPALDKILGIDLSDKKLVDTLLMSKLFNPDRGAHSLDYYGKELEDRKIEFHDWAQYSEKMLEYCKQDVRLNVKVYEYLKKEAGDWDWGSSFKLETEVGKIIQKQEERGVGFDVELAKKCHSDLNEKMKELAEKVEPLLPERDIPKSQLRYPPKKKFKKDGSPSSLARKYFGDLLEEVDGEWYVGPTPLGECTEPASTKEPMKMAHQADLKKWLLREGWKPTMYNMRENKETGKKERTSPKFSDSNKNICPNLLKLGDKVEFINDVVLWLSYRNRRNVILSDNGTGWLAHPRLDVDSRLPASADTLGTNTGRFAHRIVANVPRVSSVYGREMRSMFRARPGHHMVGWDASALEARIEAHYTYRYDNGHYASILLDGDVHQNNAEAFGCDRAMAKTVKYAVTYGAQPQKLADTLGVSQREGKRIYDEFWNTNLSLKILKERLTKYWKANGKKYIKGVDGRKVVTRSEHSLLNTLFQSAGIICMKRAMVIWDEITPEEEGAQVIHYHDEAQAEVPDSRINFTEGTCKAGENGVLSIQKAGEYYGLKVPLDAEYKVGMTWAETH